MVSMVIRNKESLYEKIIAINVIGKKNGFNLEYVCFLFGIPFSSEGLWAGIVLCLRC